MNGQRILTESEWIDEAAQLQAKHESPYLGNRIATLTRVLVELNDLIHQAPSAVRQLFSEFPEPELVTMAAGRRAVLEKEKYGWQVPRRPNSTVLIRTISAQARAIDQLLYEEREHGLPIDANIEWHCPSTDAFVIPRRSPRPSRRPSSNLACTRFG